MTTERPEDLAARAATRHVVVVGGGVSGLVAAQEFVKVGMRVTVLEASDVLGGAIRRAEIEGIVVDAGAESYATRGGHVRELISELGLSDRITTPHPGGAWLAGLPSGGAAPLPKGGILGIPANPFQDDVRRIIGWKGAWRAYVDRIRPPMTIGHQHSLGTLVASRMGVLVRDRLVAPVTGGVYSAHPDDVDVDVAAPGLNNALTRVGSLSGAVAVLNADRAAKVGSSKAPGSAVEGLAGGMALMVDALRRDIEKLGGVVLTDSPVEELRRTESGWTAVCAQTTDADGAVQPAAEYDADAVVVATTEDAARALLREHVADLGEAEPSPRIEIVTLVLDAPVLDGAPRGTGVLTVPGSFVAKALTHATAKWNWLAKSAQRKHVIRVSFGSQGEQAATADLDDAAAATLAMEQASLMLGVLLTPTMLIGAHRARFTQSQPASLIGANERRAAARAAIQKSTGLAAVGAWLAGTGLAQVVPDAKGEADRIRHLLLWVE